MCIRLAAARFSMITIFDDAALFLIQASRMDERKSAEGGGRKGRRRRRRERVGEGGPAQAGLALHSHLSSSSSAPLILDGVGPASAPCELPAADSSDDESEMPPDFLCPITMMPMQDPVMTYDGQTYERKLIEEWSCLASSEPDVEVVAVLVVVVI